MWHSETAALTGAGYVPSHGHHHAGAVQPLAQSVYKVADKRKRTDLG